MLPNSKVFREWLMKGKGVLHAAFDGSLSREQASFEQSVSGDARNRLHFTPTAAGHDQMIQTFFASWLKELGTPWRRNRAAP